MPRRERAWTRGTLCLALALGFQAAASGAAQAHAGWSGHHGYGHRSYGYHHRHYRGHDHGDSDVAVGAAVVLGGLLVGVLLAQSLADQPAAELPAAEPLALGNCKPTTGRRLINGHWALLRGTWCTDQYGRGYILNDSVRFVRYLD